MAIAYPSRFGAPRRCFWAEGHLLPFGNIGIISTWCPLSIWIGSQSMVRWRASACTRMARRWSTQHGRSLANAATRPAADGPDWPDAVDPETMRFLMRRFVAVVAGVFGLWLFSAGVISVVVKDSGSFVPAMWSNLLLGAVILASSVILWFGRAHHGNGQQDHGRVSGLPRDNRESWRVLREHLFSDGWGPGWAEWLAKARQIVGSLEHVGMVEHFRAGVSMDLLIFSTQNHHDLDGAICVQVRPESESGSVRVALGPTLLHWDPPDIDQTLVPMESCLPVILDYLRRLWTATKPGVDLPGKLAPQ